MGRLALRVLPEVLGICRLSPDEAIPSWATAGAFYSVTRTPEELSIVCSQASIPAGVTCESGWRALQVEGPLDFSLTGILAELSAVLARHGVSIFAVSTYDTDYLLVKEASVQAAVQALSAADYTIRNYPID